MVKGALVASLLGSIFIGGCGKKKKTSNISAEMRSTGDAPDFKLTTTNAENPVNNMAKIESYKVPIDAIRLATGLNGSGYTGASPNFYECPKAKDAECTVDLTHTSAIQNLLQGSSQKKVEVSESKTYEGIAVEFCHEHASTKADGYFTIWLKASVILEGTTYYTNKTEGLSTTAPAQEVEIKSNYGGCGVTTHLIQAVTLAPESTVAIVLYGDPRGSVYGSQKKPSGNESCVGNSAETAYICSDFVSIFGTVDTAAPTIERYQLDIKDHQSGLMTMMFNSTGDAFGASIRPLFKNDNKTPSVGANDFLSVSKSSDSTYTFETYDNNRNKMNMFSGFKREDHSSTLKIQDGTSLSYDATRLK